MSDLATQNQPRLANQRSVARLVAVQALYQMDVGGASLPTVLAEFETIRTGDDGEGNTMRPADNGFFRNLVGGVVDRQRAIDPEIHQSLPETWPLKRIDVTLRAILRCGTFELMNKSDVPAKVIITEYVDIAKAFFNEDEPGLVNAVLDHVARKERSDELSSA